MKLRICTALVLAGLLTLSVGAAGADKRLGTTINGGDGGSIQILNGGTGELLMGDVKDGGFFMNDTQSNLAKYKKECPLNVVTPIKTLPTEGITGLRVEGNLACIAVEPSQSDKIELEYVGVADAGFFTVDTKTAEGILTVSVKGKSGRFFYANPTSGARANTVRVGLPAGKLKSFAVTEETKTASILVSGMNLPAAGRIGNGIVILEDEKRTASAAMETANGSLTVKGKTLAGSISLTAENGSVSVQGDNVSGKAVLTAKNGSVKMEADKLREAVLTANNGSVKGIVGTVGENVKADVKNGSIKFDLVREPENLKYIFVGNDAFQNKSYSLPSGWEKSRTVGNGKPTLTLGCDNGSMKFTVGKYKAPKEIANAAFQELCPDYVLVDTKIMWGNAEQFTVHFDRKDKSGAKSPWEMRLVQAETDGSFDSYCGGDKELHPIPLKTVKGYAIMASGNTISNPTGKW